MKAKLLEYIYSYDSNRGSVGYYNCVPRVAPDFSFVLELLQTRPYDTFLHSHALNLLSGNFQEITAQCAKTRDPVFLALVAELRMLEPDKKCHSDNIPPAACELLPYSPLPLLALSEEAFFKRTALSAVCREHLEKMLPIEEIPEIQLESGSDEAIFPACSGDIINIESAMLKENSIAPDNGDKEFWKLAEERLQRAGLAQYPEMRHEATLSPIALLRQWPVTFYVQGGNAPYRVNGVSTAYGRGLTLAQARTSLRMEIVERASAFASISPDWEITGSKQKNRLVQASIKDLEAAGLIYYAPFPADLIKPYEQIPFFWFTGKQASGENVYIPAQAVFLFCNLEEPAIFEAGGSTGLGAGATVAQAKLSALLEVIERDAHAATPFMPGRFFRLTSRNPLLRGLFEDYAARHIFPVFQDITMEIGVPAYRCFARGLNGETACASAAKLSGKNAALAALTETSWPYSWATPAPFGKPTIRPDSSLPIRFIEDLPDFDPGSNETGLALLETLLNKLNLSVYYCDLTREDLNLPVFRAFIKGLETHAEFDGINLPPRRLVNNLKRLKKSGSL